MKEDLLTQPATPPDITTPLVSNPNQTAAVGPDKLGLLDKFRGTWNSPTGSQATGYNVMPLPQSNTESGFIVKDFPYFEEITFAPIAGGAPNREGNYTQNSGVLFYEQRVYFANNPDPNGTQPIENTLVHAENGSWLYHNITTQVEGPYGPGTVPPPNPLPVQPASAQYNKQVSVPHGNSVLMVGGLGPSGEGIPEFPMVDKGLPPFSGSSIIDPTTVLIEQLGALADQGITVTSYDSVSVSTKNLGGGVSNIHFEGAFAQVDSMDTTWYVETLSNNKVQLQYVQTIILQFIIKGVPTQFAHVTANTLQKVESASI